MAQDYNKVAFTGRLTRDPELKMVAEDAYVANFGLAVNRPKKKGEDDNVADFFEVSVWGKQAENLANYKNKGDQVLVEGVLRYRTWEAEDGSKRSAVSILAFYIQYLASKGEGKGNGGGQQQQSKKNKSTSDEVEFSEDDFEDIPF